MLLAHLLPFLDAEIDRLQQARDLLTQLSSLSSAQTTQASVAVDADVSAATQPAPHPSLAEPQSVTEQSPQIVVLKPHGLKRGWRHTRRRAAPPADAALRSSVPAGPVVVSAEEVRRAQAVKPAPASRPAEELSLFAWQSPAHEKRDLGALLQKLMDLGTKDDTPQPSPARV